MVDAQDERPAPDQPAVDFTEAVAELLALQVTDLVFSPLSGGVSSDIWRVDTPDSTYCAKRALAKLRVAADWQAPVERSREEAHWLQQAIRIIPGKVPRVMAHDEGRGIILLSWYDPTMWQNFKTQLLLGNDPGKRFKRCASETGSLLGRVHHVTRAMPELQEAFAHFEYFDALRLDPFLRFSADRHPSVAPILRQLITELSENRWALVHGDVSPKNILMDDRGEPVLLDAECACWGNPAFDVAFMLSHLLLKVLHTQHRESIGTGLAQAFWTNYLKQHGPMSLKNRELKALDQTTAQLVPALLLARIDGKSPVEYLDDIEKDQVRHLSIEMIRRQFDNTSAMITYWGTVLRRY